MPTSSSDSPGRGGLTLTASALGLALVVWGAVLLASPPLRLSWPDGLEFGSGHGADGTAADALAETEPFVVEPSVRFEPRAADHRPRPHPAWGRPQAVVIPELGVRASVVPIRVEDAELRPPDDPTTLGWWRDGSRPGALVGSALVTGHTVHAGGGALDDLETLRPGDRVRVRTARGIVSYDVTAVAIYRKGRLARDAQRVFSQSVPGRLVLVTCEDWNGTTYLSNAVVFAEQRRRFYR